ncbi:helix-turn-helix domain-containing protein [Clostridium drakei]|uniref:Transcriptional regulator n=1 Tax=Clostridium drakei TaxID=332101 RepID=A0A2U8DVS9_9CLOT|nr:helix-turn-helix transcriptional regulator [Clostridium drakei]AWI06749.1 transcriptional regulator [Clostridium drakei]
MSFGERLKELRQEKKITQANIGELLGVTERMISYYESGKHFLRDAESLIKLADFLDVSVDYLVGSSKIKNYNDSLQSFKLYMSLPEKGKQEVDEYIRFLKHKYKLR